MPEFDWTRFTVRVPVNADPAKLYWCWATREGMEYWFLRVCEYVKPDGVNYDPGGFVQPGDRYRWLWHGWSDEVEEKGVILGGNGRNRFAFSFGKAGNCTITIKEEKGQVMVELVQDQIPDDEQGRHYWHVGCKTGWTFYLANLKSLLEGGIDLRNRDAELLNVINS